MKQVPLLALVFVLSSACAEFPNHTSQEQSKVTISSTEAVVKGTEVASERTQYEEIRVVEVVGELENPWSVAFLPEGEMLITERPGRLNLVADGELTEISGLPEISMQGQGGLLDVSVHPNYNQNGWIYWTYSKPNNQGQTATALARGRIEENTLVDVEEIFVQNRYSQPGRHYGSRLAWTNEGTLLMSIGDRGSDPPRAQDNSDHAGTLIRLNDDGSIPEDNPFVEDENVLDAIYAYGLRNVQGIVVNPDTNEIWVTDHGPRGGDELNRIEAGKNYGWPQVTRGLDYRTEETFPYAKARRAEGVEDPFYEFLPTHAPSGLALVAGNHFQAWQGNLLVGGLSSERIRRVVFNDREVLHEEELLLQTMGRIRDVKEGPDDYIYVLSDEADGGLYRIEPDS